MKSDLKLVSDLLIKSLFEKKPCTKREIFCNILLHPMQRVKCRFTLKIIVPIYLISSNAYYLKCREELFEVIL